MTGTISSRVNSIGSILGYAASCIFGAPIGESYSGTGAIAYSIAGKMVSAIGNSFSSLGIIGTLIEGIRILPLGESYSAVGTIIQNLEGESSFIIGSGEAYTDVVGQNMEGNNSRLDGVSNSAHTMDSDLWILPYFIGPRLHVIQVVQATQVDTVLEVI